MAQIPVPFTVDETKIWEAEFMELTGSFARDQQGERIRLMFDRNKEFLRNAGGIAKSHFQGASFGGVDAQGGFGWTLLRPEHLLHTTANADSVNIDWKRSPATDGFNYFIGSATVFNQINRRALVVLLGIVNHQPTTKSVGAQFQIEGILYPPYDFYTAMRLLGSARVWSLPKPKVIPPLGQLKLQMRDVDTGLDEPQILGITYAESGYLQTQVPDLEAP